MSTDKTAISFLRRLAQRLPGSRVRSGALHCAGQLAVEVFEYSRPGSGIWRVRARRPRQDKSFVLELSVIAAELEAAGEIALAYLDRAPLPVDSIAWESPPSAQCFYAWSQAAVDRYANPKTKQGVAGSSRDEAAHERARLHPERVRVSAAKRGCKSEHGSSR